jgi:hypothetical protein
MLLCHEILKLLLLHLSLPRLLLLHLLPLLVLLSLLLFLTLLPLPSIKQDCFHSRYCCLTWCKFVHLASLALPPQLLFLLLL